MIRMLHFADLHLGVESYGRIDATTGLSTRFEDFLAALDQVVEYAVENRVDLVLFCGDAYKSRDPSQTQQREFARRIGRLASSGIPVFLLVGNHDLPNAIGRATAVEIFDTLAIDNVKVANRPGTSRIQTRGGPLQVVALPWAGRNVLLSREENKNLTIDEINDKLQQRLTDLLQDNIRNLDPDLPSILAAHVFLSTAKPGSEQTMMMGREHFLLQSNVANPAFDYVALGHIHRHQVLSHYPPIVYAGSLERLDFGEEEDDKGFYVVEIEGKGKIAFDFHPIQARRFVTIRVHIDSQDPDPTLSILGAIAQRQPEIKDAIVRLHIALPAHGEGLVQDREIRRALEEAHFIAAIAKEIERQPRIRLGGWSTKALTPLEALEAYLAQKAPPERQRLLKYGRSLIHEEAGEQVAPTAG